MNDRRLGGPIDRFCAKHPRFGIPNLMKILVFIQLGVWLADFVCGLMGSFSLTGQLYFSPFWILRGEVWRLITWVVLPASDNPFSLALTCYFYYWVASALERMWGTARFTLFYLSGAVLSVVLGLILGLLQPAYSFYAMDLAYYLNLSIFLVLATIFGEQQVLLFFVVPVKMKWMALLDLVLVITDAAGFFRMGAWSFGLIPLASFINYFLFTWPFWQRKLGMARRRTDPTVINFKKARQQVEKTQKTQQAQGYRRKCAVCGVTDADDPNMEFRYCSKCDGYHCYCMDHINNHVHIKKD